MKTRKNAVINLAVFVTIFLVVDNNGNNKNSLKYCKTKEEIFDSLK